MTQIARASQKTMSSVSQYKKLALENPHCENFWAFVKVSDESSVRINRVVIKAENQFEAYMLLKAIYGDFLLSKCAYPMVISSASAR